MRHAIRTTKPFTVFIIPILTLSLAMVACTKKRNPSFPQGSGENLEKISDYDGKTFEIVTGDRLADNQQRFSKASEVILNSNRTGLGAFSLVTYTVSDSVGKKLLGDTPIVGRPHAKYKGLIRIDEKYLKIYKVGKKEDIPLQEVTYADPKESQDGFLAIPLVGYPVADLITIDRQKNEYNEQSSVLIEKKQKKPGEASHFRFDLSKPELFEAVVKTDVFPASFFDPKEDWYFAVTTTGAPDEKADEVGVLETPWNGQSAASRIKFLKDESTLRIADANIDPRLAGTDNNLRIENYKIVSTIPVVWKAFKVSGKGKGMKEEEDSTLLWDKRPFVQLALKDAKTGDESFTRLVAIEVTDDYFSYTLENAKMVRSKYAFRKAKASDYPARQAFTSDLRNFGFFMTHRALVQTFENRRTEDMDRTRFLRRFHPRKNIVYHFSKTTPQWIRPAAREVMNKWDQAFQAAGTAVRLVLDESKDVELGDIRYNIINGIESVGTSKILGTGSSVVDPLTGEIISATVNIYLNSQIDSIVPSIQTFILAKSGQLDGAQIAGLARASAEKNSVARAAGDVHKKIESDCPEVLRYVTELRASQQDHKENEIEVVKSCARKLLAASAIGTLVHEWGHTFGLRHNFYGSADAQNFSVAEPGKEQEKTSSVMDYIPENILSITKPGPYDIAALRYGYADAVSTIDHRIVKLDTKQSISENLKAAGATLQPFKYCTDTDINPTSDKVPTNIDPMCAQNDLGTTPLEVVNNIIARYEAHYQFHNYRRGSGRSQSGEELATSRQNHVFLPLLRFYEEWREGMARFVGRDRRYLTDMTTEEEFATIERMKADPRYAALTTLYAPAAEEVFRFFMKLLATPNRACLVANAEGQSSLIELSALREEGSLPSGVLGATCAEVKNHLKEKGWSVVSEVGQEFTSFRYDSSAQARDLPFDVIGTQGDRLAALTAMTSRNSLSYLSTTQKFAPSMMDEPRFRDRLKEYIVTRLTKGIPMLDLAAYVGLEDGSDLPPALRSATFANFASEKELLSKLLPQFLSAVAVPGQPAETEKRLTSLAGDLTRSMSSELAAKAVARTQLPGSKYFVVTEAEARDAIALTRAHARLANLKNGSAFELNAENAAFVNKLKEILPADAGALNAMTVQQAMNMLPGLDPVLKPLLENRDRGEQIKTLFGDLQNLYVLRNLVESTRQESAEKARQILEASLVTSIKSRGGDFSLTADQVDVIIQKNNEQVQTMTQNRSETSAQLNLLTEALTALGQ